MVSTRRFWILVLLGGFIGFCGGGHERIAQAIANYKSALAFNSTSSSWLSATGATSGRGIRWDSATDMPVVHQASGAEITWAQAAPASGYASGIINVKDAIWGAIGDGAHDDTAAIQAAINAAPSGSPVFFPPGTYNVSGSGAEVLLINKPVHLNCAAGWGTTLQVASTVPNTRDVIHVTSPAQSVGFKMTDCVIAAVNGAAKTITGATNVSGIVITTSTSHGYSTGQTVTVSGVLGNTNANGTWVITVTDGTHFSLNGSNGSGAYTSGGTVAAVPGRHGINLDVTTGGNPIQNLQIDHNWIQQLGGRAISVTNTVPSQDGVYVMDIRDNFLRGGINLANAGDSIVIEGNVITGGFNAIDVGIVQNAILGGGAHALVISKNNVTSQGCFIHATSASDVDVENNNVEPGATGSFGSDANNCSNGAIFDIDCSSTNPCVNWHVRNNYLANWANTPITNNVLRANWTQGAIIENNDAELTGAGPVQYVITANAVATVLTIAPTESGALPAAQVSDASPTTITHFYNNSGVEEFGAISAKHYEMLVHGGNGQTSDLFDVQTNAGVSIFKINLLNSTVLTNGATDNGYPFHAGGPAYFDSRIQLSGNVAFNTDKTYTLGTATGGALQAFLTGTTNQLVLGTSGHTATVSSTAPAAANNTLTIPDTGGSDTFSFLALAQTFTGIQKFSGGIKMTNLLLSATAPTVSSGFGTGASITANNGPAAFRIGVGTTSGTTGVIGLPAATTGWNCYCTDITTNSTGVFSCKQTASTTTSATIGNFSDVAVATAWTNSDVLAVSCFAY